MTVTTFDPLITTAAELQTWMSDGKLTSRVITQRYLDWITAHDPYLKAVQSLNPRVLQQAEEMDAMRTAGTVLGPLHGIPVLLKDNIDAFPELEMETTAGAAALKGSRSKTSARIVDMLVRSGAVIIGKGIRVLEPQRGSGLPCGWSAAGGQGQNPYIVGGYNPSDTPCGHSTPAGSSSGPAIAVSAGLVPVAVGAETIGSLVTPATRQSLYTLKPTHGIVPATGIVPLCGRFDSAGPMSKSALDLANVLTAIVEPSSTNIPPGGYASAARGGGSGSLKIGTLNPQDWKYDTSMFKEGDKGFDQIARDTTAAYRLVGKFAQTMHENIPLRPADDYNLDGQNVTLELFYAEFRDELDTYLQSLERSQVRSLKDVVEWNKTHASEALPKAYDAQDLLVQSLENKATPEEVSRLLGHMKEVGANFIEMFQKYDLDLIIAPGDSWLCTHAAAMGAPVGVVPMSYLDFNGRPIALMVAAQPHQDAKIIEFMSMWEQVADGRRPPTAFLQRS